MYYDTIKPCEICKKRYIEYECELCYKLICEKCVEFANRGKKMKFSDTDTICKDCL